MSSIHTKSLSDVDASTSQYPKTNSLTSTQQSKCDLSFINDECFQSMTGQLVTAESKQTSTYTTTEATSKQADRTTEATSNQTDRTSTATAGI